MQLGASMKSKIWGYIGYTHCDFDSTWTDDWNECKGVFHWFGAQKHIHFDLIYLFLSWK